MRKLILLNLSLLLPALVLLSQPVVDGSAFTSASSSLVYTNAAPTWQPSFVLENSGENLTWDITNFAGNVVNQEAYASIAGLSFFYQLVFNSPNNADVRATHFIEIDQPEIDFGQELPIEVSDIYSFYRNDTTGYYQVGVSFSASGFPLLTPFTDTDRIYGFPLNYDNRDTSFSDFYVEVPLLGGAGQYGWRYNHVDAWGTLLTPNGNYDVLRVRAERLLTDTFNVPDFELVESIERPLQIDYSWISPNEDGELLRISTVGGTIITAQYRGEILLSTSNVAGLKSLSVSPNPSQGPCTVRLPSNKPGHLDVYDITGRQVYAMKTSGNVHRMDAALWPDGLYILRFVDYQGQIYSTKLTRSLR